jgi:hypothetical protein
MLALSQGPVAAIKGWKPSFNRGTESLSGNRISSRKNDRKKTWIIYSPDNRYMTHIFRVVCIST